MVFSSLVFLCIFLPITYILHTIIPNIKWKNVLLIIVSLMFYAYGEPIYVFLMLGSVLLNYVSARFIAKYEKRKKTVLAINVVLNLGILGVFKYAVFLVETVNGMLGIGLPVPAITLPIGISFFTFQAMSYVIDVYRGIVDVQRKFHKVLLYISFFPQLIAGPIVKYRDICEQIDQRSADPKKTAEGLRRFVCGLGKKVLISNAMGNVVDIIFASESANVNAPVAWLGAIAYMFQIYYDFSGYSDMAIGLGKMFGFDFEENFCYPYGSTSIKEFWRRWHISLSTWFKEYLYIPLGGNRKGKVRTCINKMIVFFCTGLWHGANWTFVLWGIYHGCFLLLEEYVPIKKKMPKILGYIYALVVVCVGFVLFRADTIGDGIHMITKMFTGFQMTAASTSLLMQQLTPWFITVFVAAIIGAAPIRLVKERMKKVLSTNWMNRILYAFSFVILAWCVIRLSSGTYNPFIYFRF